MALEENMVISGYLLGRLKHRLVIIIRTSENIFQSNKKLANLSGRHPLTAWLAFVYPKPAALVYRYQLSCLRRATYSQLDTSRRGSYCPAGSRFLAAN